MDMRGFDDERLGGGDNAAAQAAAEGAVDDRMFDLGGDERRMHVRAYNHWVSLLKGRPYPSIKDLDPASIADFGPHSVLLDFSRGLENPAVAFLGRALKEECGLLGNIRTIADVPARSLLSRLTDHYLQIIANHAPIGFEAEFVGNRGRQTLYRGILMPFSSDGEQIDFIYGVINWKEMVDAATQATLAAELGEAVRHAPKPVDAPVWADGPGAEVTDEAIADETLEGRLALARETAAALGAANIRSRAALYRALGRAHDFALAADADADGYAALLADAGIRGQGRAPMTPVAKLVFGADYDKTRLTEFAAVLDHARRHAVAPGALPGFLDLHAGGIKAVVAAERAARRPMPRPDMAGHAAAQLRTRVALAQVALAPEGDGEFVVLVARVSGEGLDVVAQVAGPAAFVEGVLRRAAG